MSCGTKHGQGAIKCSEHRSRRQRTPAETKIYSVTSLDDQPPMAPPAKRPAPAARRPAATPAPCWTRHRAVAIAGSLLVLLLAVGVPLWTGTGLDLASFRQPRHLRPAAEPSATAFEAVCQLDQRCPPLSYLHISNR